MNKLKYKDILTKDFLQKLYVDSKLSTTKIAEITGISDMTISAYLKRYDIALRPFGVIPQTYVGQKFGHLTCIKCCGRLSSKSRNYVYECLCDCGQIKKVVIGSLKAGLTTSCGCVRREKASKSKTWKGSRSISASYLCAIRHGAKLRGYDFDLTAEQLQHLFDKQCGKCAISQLDISNDYSLDRIDNTKGYTLDNVQWLHKDVNRMKWKHGQEYFIDLCKRIAQHNA